MTQELRDEVIDFIENKLKWDIQYAEGHDMLKVAEFVYNTIELLQGRQCGVCGGAEVQIRGKYPQNERRYVCPTCTYEKLEQIHDIASPDYGKSYINEPIIGFD